MNIEFAGPKTESFLSLPTGLNTFRIEVDNRHFLSPSINMLEPSIIVAIISAASLIFTTTVKEASNHLGKRENEDTSETTTLSAQSVTAVSSPKVLELNETLQSIDRRMDKKEMEVKSLQKRINKIHAEGLELDRRADEAIETYGTNVQVTMLLHGLGSIFLQLNYPYFGTPVSVLMLVSFFSTFAIAFIVSFNKIKKMSQWEKVLRRRERELQKDITSFETEIKRTYSDEEFKRFLSTGAFGEALNGIGSLDREARAMQNAITGMLENSCNSESNRMKSLFQVAACAVIYGLSFPMMAYYLLSFVNLKRMRFGY